MRRAIAAGAAALGLLLTGCPGGEPAPAPSPTTPSPSPSPSPTRSPGLSPSPSPSPSPTVALSEVAVRLERIASLSAPLALAVRPGDDALYVAEKGGHVHAIRGGRVESGTVLDLSGEVSGGSEQGLLGLAFSPDGERLYVNLTDRAGDTRVREYEIRGGRPAASSARDVLRVDQPFANHNGGNLVFGPDGMLWIGLGDGGSGGDPRDHAQSLDTLLGAMLRIDPRPADGRAYRIPDDNPLVGRPGRDEIWAWGLRNPWRYSFDRETGDLWIGDVGQNRWEEVDFVPAGSPGGINFGWNRFEGRHRFEGSPPEDHHPPILEYPLREGACAVTGGFVYRGSAVPELRGAYVFADFCVGRLRAVRQQGGSVVDDAFLGPEVASLASFGEDAGGELYVLSLDGGVWRLAPR